MILTGHPLSLFQLCRRKFVLESNWRKLRWYPSTLFSACVRQAILSLSQGAQLSQTITSAINQFTSNCKYPGLDLAYGTDTYTLAMDYCACIRTILTYLSSTSIPKLKHKSPISIHPDLTWSFLNLEDESNSLHRYSFPDFIHDNSKTKEGHSWELFGDLVLSNSPMTLHLISIGRREGNHLSSPWCRAYRSPAINMYRFQRKSGEGLEGAWKPIWFGENRDNDPEVWVGIMKEDGVISSIVKNYSIPYPDQVHAENFRRDLEYEFSQIKSLGELKFSELPITRPSCDSPYSCPHQFVCYSKSPEKEIESCGLYESLIAKRGRGRPKNESNSEPEPTPQSTAV